MSNNFKNAKTSRPPHRHAIWNSSAEIPSSYQLRPPTYAKDSTTTNAFPEQEAARMAALKRLRHKLVNLCGKQQHNSKPPTLAMERWLSRESLQRELDTNSKQTQRVRDPILPSSGIADEGLIKDLSRNINNAESKTIAETLTADSKNAADRIASFAGDKSATNPNPQNWNEAKHQLKTCTKAVKKASKQVQKNISAMNNDDDGESDAIPTCLTALHEATQALDTCRQKIQRIQDYASGKNIVLDNSRRSGICDVMLVQADGTPKKPYLTISTSHLIKFVQLWQFRHGGKSISPKNIAQNPSTAIPEMAASSSFLRHLYCCLSRYEMIKGAGYQCAMPPAAFDAAHSELGLGTTIECFASPFNCRYRQYCSAFPDLETNFGSLGSFFDDNAFFPTNGSFESNPPFVPEIMWAMNEKLQRLLENRKAKALSFLVIVPAWGAAGIGYVEQLEASEYCVAKSRVLAADHSFCDGAQHKALKQELRPSSWDTAVILLQNQDGRNTWPVSQETLESVFCAALKSSKAQSSLAEWERRGVGKGGSTKHNGKRPYPAASASQSTTLFQGKRHRF